MRQRKPQHDQHQFTGVEGMREITVVGRGRGVYLWAHDHGRDPFQALVFSGRKSLRALAFAILDATGGREEVAK